MQNNSSLPVAFAIYVTEKFSEKNLLLSEMPAQMDKEKKNKAFKKWLLSKNEENKLHIIHK